MGRKEERMMEEKQNDKHKVRGIIVF